MLYCVENIPYMLKLGFINQNCGSANHVLCEKEYKLSQFYCSLVFTLVFISTGNCSDSCVYCIGEFF